ncbi:unannotated protein [freshwater metagenome]|uniref:Unannotated protein n=1 Tax=freshwater metagenome TaxID=449393 RepID=A0A6J7I4A7_9ZZZZ
MICRIAVAIGISGPVQGVGNQHGAAFAAEDLECIQRRFRRHPGDNIEVRQISRGVVRPCVRFTARDTKSSRTTCHVRAVSFAIQWVVIGPGFIEAGVVVAREVVAACDLVGFGIVGCDTTFFGCKRSLVIKWRARSAEISVGVVDAGIDDADGHAFARTARIGPSRRSAGEVQVRAVTEALRGHAVHSVNSRQIAECTQF